MAAGTLAASSLQARSATWTRQGSFRPGTVFPFGAHFYREPSPPLDQLRADMPVLKKLGFNLLNVQQSWSVNEPREGQIELEKIESIVAAARDYSLSIYFTITMEQAPAWLWKKYPDARMVYENSQPLNDGTQYLLPQDGKPGPCWKHPEARSAAERFLAVMARRIGRFDNIAVWNVWQEISLDPESSPDRLGLCYCPNTLNAFRTWLQSRYLTLEALNKTWQTSFGQWDEVEPPRRFAPVPSLIDWRFYMEDVYLTEVLRWKREAVRGNDPEHRPVMAHTAAPRLGGSSDWSYAEEVDLYGSSCYPGWGEVEDISMHSRQRIATSPAIIDQMHDVVLRCDYARSAAKGGDFWIAEMQGGRAPGGFAPGRVPDAADLRRWVLLSLASGARGICFWNHRSEIFENEAYGFGLLDSEGDHTERASEAGRISHAIQQNAAALLGLGSKQRASVAILVDEDLHHFIDGFGQASRELEERNIRGLHRMLWLNGFSVDFIHRAELDAIAHEGATAYKAVFLPLPIALTAEAFDALTLYARNGGVLVSDACVGRFSRYGMAFPGEMAPQAQSLFGVTQKRLVSLADNHQDRAGEPPLAGSGVRLEGQGSMVGHSVAGSGFLQIFDPAEAVVVLGYEGLAAGTMHTLDRGRAILLGTLLGAGFAGKEGVANGTFLIALLRSCGVERPGRGVLIEARRHLGDEVAIFLVNPTHEPATGSIEVDASFRYSTLFGEPLAPAKGVAQVEVQAMDVTCLIARRA